MIQFLLSLLFILILIWPLINILVNLLIGDSMNIDLEALESPSFPLLPLGTDVWGNDYLLEISNAFINNIIFGTKMVIVFLFFGVIFGLGIGFKKNNEKIFITNNKIYAIERIRRIFSWFSENFINCINSIPLILLIILTVLYCQSNFNKIIQQNMIIFFIGLFLTPSIAIPLSGRIRELIKQDFIIACKAMGMHPLKIIFKHILKIESKDLILSKISSTILYSIIIDFFLYYFKYADGTNTIGRLITISRFNLNYRHWGSTDSQYILIALAPLILLILLNINLQWLNKRIISIYQNG